MEPAGNLDLDRRHKEKLKWDSNRTVQIRPAFSTNLDRAIDGSGEFPVNNLTVKSTAWVFLQKALLGTISRARDIYRGRQNRQRADFARLARGCPAGQSENAILYDQHD